VNSEVALVNSDVVIWVALVNSDVIWVALVNSDVIWVALVNSDVIWVAWVNSDVALVNSDVIWVAWVNSDVVVISGTRFLCVVRIITSVSLCYFDTSRVIRVISVSLAPVLHIFSRLHVSSGFLPNVIMIPWCDKPYLFVIKLRASNLRLYLLWVTSVIRVILALLKLLGLLGLMVIMIIWPTRVIFTRVAIGRICI
jgi:hypothetical protein